MKARGIFAILAAKLAGWIGAMKVPDAPKWRKPEQHRHNRRAKPRGGTGAAGSKLWHRLTTGHSAAAGWPGRRARQYAARGYGYIAPEPKKVPA